MALPQKGLRKIVVGGDSYFWLFKQKIFVTTKDQKNLLIVDFGWFDVWLYVNDPENRPADFEPRQVTPKFISDSIVFALENGWSKGKMELQFRNGIYKQVK